MNRKSNNFNVLWLLAMTVILGFSLLSLNPSYTNTSRDPLALQIENYLEREEFSLKGGSRSEFVTYLLATAKDYEFDPLLILAIMKVESSFDPDAMSNRGAYGLLQIKTIAAREVGTVFDVEPVAKNDLFDPFVNLRVGIQYLSVLRDYVGENKIRILSAYNMGPTHVKRSGIVSTGYSSKVMRAYRELIKNFS